MKVRPPWWWTPGSKLTFLKPPSPAEASEVTKPGLTVGEPAQQAFHFQEEWVIPGFKTRPVVPAKSPIADESGFNAWRGLLSSEFQPHTVRSRQIKLPPYSFLLMSHGPAQSLAAGSQCDVVEKNEQRPQHIQSSVLGSLAAGSVQIH